VIILGLDPAQQCGWALYDTSSSSLSSIKAGVIKASGESYEEKAATLGRGLVKLLTADRDKATGKPILPGEEQVEEASGSGLNAVISSNQMVGAVCAIIGAYGIPFETVATVTWRSQFLGFGRRAGWQRKDWKKAVRDRCNQFKITVTNDDMADAVGIAFAGKACQSFRMISARAA
jgi:Holliday junction resolvasome RuvABC endonuclease subunit